MGTIITSVGSGISVSIVIAVESEEYVAVPAVSVVVGVLVGVSVVVGVLVAVSVVVPVSLVEGVLVPVSEVVPVSPVDVVEDVSAAWWWWCVGVGVDQSRFGVGEGVDQSAIGVGEGVDQSAIGVGDHPEPVDGVGSLASSLYHHEPYRTPSSGEAK
jgi:hypothetical protein